MSEPKIKGVVFSSVFDTIAVVKSEDFRQQVWGATEGELAEALDTGLIVAPGWYPLAWYRDLWRVIRRFDPEDELVREVGRVSMELDFKVYHKLILRMLKPATVMRIAQRVYGRYLDTGGVELVEQGPRFIRARWSGVEGFDETLWMEHLSGAEHLVRLAAGDSTKLRVIAGGRQGDLHAEVEATW